MVKGLTQYMQNKTYRIIGFSVCAIVLLALILRIFVHSPQTPPIPELEAVQLKYTPVPVTKTYIGMTQSIASVDIRARVKGFLTEMDFVEGKMVEENQRLFVIDPKPFQAQVDHEKAAVARSLADEVYQKAQYERMKILVAKGDISQSYYDQVHAKYKAAVAQVQLERASLEEAEINLSYCYMNAPFTGLAGEKHVDVGNLVGGDKETLLVTILKLDPMYIQFSPSTADFAQIIAYQANQPFPVEATLPENPNMVFRGTVQLINNQANLNTSTVLMRATISNPQQLLLPNLYVQTKVILGQDPKALCIPKAAISETQGQKIVYVLDSNHQVQAQTIETGEEINNQVVVSKGLQPGMIVLTNGLQKIQPGMMVNPKLES